MKQDEDNLTALVARYYSALAGEGKDVDGHWSIAERWSYGKNLGWFVEHDGYCYGGLREDGGEDGPHLSRQEAEKCMASHLRAAIAEAQQR